MINALRNLKRHGTLLNSNVSRLDAAAESADVNDTVLHQRSELKNLNLFRFIDRLFLFQVRTL